MWERDPGWRLGAALIMGALIGPYTGDLYLTRLDVFISATALALPVLLSVAFDRALAHRAVALVLVGVPVLIIEGLVIASVMFPAVWQGGASDAGFYALVAIGLLAPVAAGFALGVGRHAVSPVTAITYGALAWAGVGIHNIVVPYALPLALSAVEMFITHSQPQNAVALGLAILVTVVVGSVYLSGFGVAVLGGWGGNVLRSRLAVRGVLAAGG